MDNELLERSTLQELEETAGAEFVRELVAAFFEEAPGMLAELQTALAAGDAARFRRAAHSMKTNASTFGLRALAEHCKALELGELPADGSGLEVLRQLYAASAASLGAAVDG